MRLNTILQYLRSKTFTVILQIATLCMTFFVAWMQIGSERQIVLLQKDLKTANFVRQYDEANRRVIISNTGPASASDVRVMVKAEASVIPRVAVSLTMSRTQLQPIAINPNNPNYTVVEYTIPQMHKGDNSIVILELQDPNNLLLKQGVSIEISCNDCSVVGE